MSAAPRRLAAVLFDLDGVLVDTARLHYAAWKRLADQIGVEFDEHRNEALKGVDRMGSLALLLGCHAARFTEVEKQRMAEQKNRWYVHSLDGIGERDLLPGAPDALDQVARSGLKMALVSASRNAAVLVERLGITHYFDTIVDPAGIQRGEASTRPVSAAARDIDVPPAHCLGIEDAPAGIAALNSAGMASIGIGSPSLLHDADWVLVDLTQFRISDYRSAA